MSAVEKYQDALYKLTQAEEAVTRVVGAFRGIASGLRDWKRVMVANASGGWPPEIALNPSVPSISADDVPTGQQLADVLQAWHKARGEAQDAYSAIPAERRTGLSPPPKST